MNGSRESFFRGLGPMRILSVAIASFALMAASAEEQREVCAIAGGEKLSVEELRANLHKRVINTRPSNVLLGVDALGRIAIAADFDKDGMSDRILLFTGQDRLDGPWSRYLSDAYISVQEGTALVTSKPDSFGMSIAVSVASPQPVPSWVKDANVHSGGRELVQLWDDKGTVSIHSLGHNDISTWPDTLWMDLLGEPPSGAPLLMGGCDRFCCDDGNCTSGGATATGCSIGGCSGSPTSCSVSGCSGGTPPPTPPTFACCKCGIDGQGGNANCRCKACQCGACFQTTARYGFARLAL